MILPFQKTALRKMLQRAGRPDTFQLLPLKGGANNRVFKIKSDGSALMLKLYFQHPEDPRDRLGAEYAFTWFAWKLGIHTVPQPIARDEHGRMALYEFIEGRSFEHGQVGETEVRAALVFLQKINNHNDSAPTGQLPEASDACFSISDHLGSVQRRIDLLKSLTPAGEHGEEAIEFVREYLLPEWDVQMERLRQAIAVEGFDPDQPVRRNERVLSPSDFGFHNAIREKDGGIRFIDFEYAGWDDPVKVVCDFFSQPEIPAPMEFLALFAEGFFEGLPRRDYHQRRLEMLLQLYRLKWCCIILNEYLPLAAERRSFSRNEECLGLHRKRQLEKAKEYFKKGIPEQCSVC